MPSEAFAVINDKGLRFNVAVVRKGDRYGLDDRKMHSDPTNLGPMVEIYDARYIGKGFTSIGQFVARYYVSTLLEDKPIDGERRGGLDMVGHVDDWKLDNVAYEMLLRFCATLK